MDALGLNPEHIYRGMSATIQIVIRMQTKGLMGSAGASVRHRVQRAVTWKDDGFEAPGQHGVWGLRFMGIFAGLPYEA